VGIRSVLAVSLIGGMTAGVAGAAPMGKLAPEIRFDGHDASGACAFVASANEATFESATGSAIEVPPGTYALRIECKSEDEVLVALGPSAKVDEGKTVAPKVDVRGARLRVQSKRSGIMLPAKVQLFPAGSGAGGKPLVELPANQKVLVAAGKYDVRVSLDDPKSPRAEVLFEKTSIGGAKLTVLDADLSDGGLIISAVENGKPASASVRVFPPGSLKDVGIVNAGEELRLPAGRYNVATELRDTSDFATKKREVWIRAGKVIRAVEHFETGTLSVSVTRDGKPVAATVRVALPKAGDFFNHFSAPGTVTLTPGVYDIDVALEGIGGMKAPARPGVKVSRGQSTRIAFDLTPATLAVKVVKSGRPIDAELRVRAAGGGEDVQPPDVSGRFRLWPGRYEIVAKLEDGEEVIDGPFEVKLGEKLSRTISVVRAMLTVVALRGNHAAADAEIEVFRPGASKPSAKGRSGAKLELMPGVYDVKVAAGPEVVWKEGVRLKTQQVVRIELKAAGADEALPEGDLTAPSDELPEGEEPALSPETRPLPVADGGVRDTGGKRGDAGGRDAGALPAKDAAPPDAIPIGPIFPDAGANDGNVTPLRPAP
jgi:hypothetical protein